MLEPAGRCLNIHHIAYAGTEGGARPRPSPHYLLDIYRENHLDRCDVLLELNPAHTRAIGDRATNRGAQQGREAMGAVRLRLRLSMMRR